ncbi:glycoside hydrolase family 172 protein [Gracilibacillus salitolerans]|uniref:glycoside hydrolase family 172 protein n=1 Tax=Gracilibacillus salitolerans TaxID=2663022 RepID=UPI003898E7F2
MYRDNEENPSVRVLLEDFFWIGHGVSKHFVSLPINMVSGEKRGPKGPFAAAMNSYFPMPFNERAVIKIITESEEEIKNLFYYIDEQYEDTDSLPADMGTCHASWNRENPTQKVEYETDVKDPAPWDLPGKNLDGLENYVILDAEGKGHFVDCVLNIDNFNASNQEYTWPGEGDDMFFIDGEVWPSSLHGTGTEDYFNAA